jgi:hypothetical protein
MKAAASMGMLSTFSNGLPVSTSDFTLGAVMARIFRGQNSPVSRSRQSILTTNDNDIHLFMAQSFLLKFVLPAISQWSAFFLRYV